MDDDEEIDAISVGDVVWWQRGEEVWDWTPGPPRMEIHPVQGVVYPVRTYRCEASVLTGKIRAIRLEEPSFVYAVIAAYPDGRILQVPLHWLSKEMPTDPVSEESPEMALP